MADPKWTPKMSELRARRSPGSHSGAVPTWEVAAGVPGWGLRAGALPCYPSALRSG